jgi:hypothetical protein
MVVLRHLRLLRLRLRVKRGAVGLNCCAGNVGRELELDGRLLAADDGKGVLQAAAAVALGRQGLFEQSEQAALDEIQPLQVELERIGLVGGSDGGGRVWGGVCGGGYGGKVRKVRIG